MNPWRGLGGLPREVWVLSAATFINRAGTMALPFLALYLMKQMGLGAAQAGQGFVVYGLGAMVAAPLGGWLADRFGPLPVMRTSLLLSGVLMLGLPLVRDVRGFFLLIGAWALVSEGFRPASMSILADLAPRSLRKAVFSLNRLAINTLMIVALEVRLNLATAHWPHRRTMMLGSLLYAIGFGAMVVAHSPALIVATVVVWTFGEMVLFPAMSDYVAAIAPPARRGAYMGIYALTFSVAFSFGPWLGTWMLDAWGGLVLWPLMGVLGMLSALALARIRPRAQTS